MDVFEFNDVKAEKAKAMLRFNRLRTIAILFRLLEICLALLLLSWISARLPLAVRISGHFFQRLFSVIISPLFIFLISNVIVITLLAKSGQLSGRTPTVDNAGTDLYEEFINYGSENCPPAPEPEAIVFQDKQIVSEVKNRVPVKSNEVSIVASVAVSEAKTLRRSQSEKLKKESSEKKLRRSETEKCRKIVESGEVPAVVDKLSNEEFQRTIEEFIAKQVKFHQEEKMAIAVTS